MRLILYLGLHWGEILYFIEEKSCLLLPCSISIVHNYAVPCNILVYVSVLVYIDVIRYLTD